MNNNKKYLKSISENLNKVVGKELGEKIFHSNSNFNLTEQTESDIKLNRSIKLIDQLKNGEELTNKEIKELRKNTGLNFPYNKKK